MISGDTALSEAAPQAASENLIPHSPTVIPSSHAVEALADFLNAGDNVTLLCGAGCAGAHDEVIELASRLKAPIVHTLRGKEYLEWGNPFDVGMTGLIGFASGYHAMLDCDTLLLLGTDFPYRQFYPQEARIAQLDIRGEHLGNRCRLNLGVIGDVKATLGLLVERITEKLDKQHLERAVKNYRETRADLDALAALTPGRKPIHPQTVASSEQARNGGRHFHLRCRRAHRVGGPPPEHEWKAPTPGLLFARLDGECDASSHWRSDVRSRS